MKPLGLYIHIPYCDSKCGYCDFTSYVGKKNTAVEYIDAVCSELDSYNRPEVDTIYIGGGTPSCLKSGEIYRLMNEVYRRIKLCDNAEISSEANPNSMTAEKAREFSDAGINRLSMGLQSTDDAVLKYIGRLHKACEVEPAIENAINNGIDNISLDLMYSIPHQSIESVRKDMEAVTAYPVKHISAYALRLEHGTPMYKDIDLQPDDDTDREMFEILKNGFESKGFFRYEISNFAKKGYECRHNLKYWRNEQYIGLGAAAHSCYDGYRFGNTANLEAYINRIKNNESAVVSRELAEPETEEIMLRLRLREGISVNNPALKNKKEKIDVLIKHNLAYINKGQLILTDEGLNLHNSVVIHLTD